MKKYLVCLLILFAGGNAFAFRITSAEAFFGGNEWIYTDANKTNLFVKADVRSDWGFSILSRAGLFPFEEPEKPVKNRISNTLSFLRPFQLSDYFSLYAKTGFDSNIYYTSRSDSFSQVFAAAGLGFKMKSFITSAGIEVGGYYENHGDWALSGFLTRISAVSEQFYFSSESFYQTEIEGALKSRIDPVKEYRFYELCARAKVLFGLTKETSLFVEFILLYYPNAFRSDYNPASILSAGFVLTAKPEFNWILRFMQKSIYTEFKEEKEYAFEFAGNIKIR